MTSHALRPPERRTGILSVPSSGRSEAGCNIDAVVRDIAAPSNVSI